MSDQLKQVVEYNKILEIVSGSNLYGTNTPTSDEDFTGIFIAPINYYFGMKTVNEVDDSLVSKNEAGKNNSDAIDKKYYEIREFFKLAFNNNPNILELLFTNNETLSSSTWQTIKNNAGYFLDSNMVKNRFKGYAFSQKKKMIVKLENYDVLKEAYDILNNENVKFLVESEKFKEKFEFRNNKESKEFKVADIFIPKNISVKRGKEILGERLGRVGNRQELILKYGYDVKFGSHLIRILLEGIELLETQKLQFPLSYASTIKEIKDGKWGLQKVLDYSEVLENRIDSLVFEPFKRNEKIVDTLLKNILNNYFTNK